MLRTAFSRGIKRRLGCRTPLPPPSSVGSSSFFSTTTPPSHASSSSHMSREEVASNLEEAMKTAPWKRALSLEAGKDDGTFIASVLAALYAFHEASTTVRGLQDDVQKEKELREEVEKRLLEAVKHERELRAEAVRAAEAQVDRRVLDLLHAEEYQSVRAKLHGVKKQVGRDGQEKP